GRQLTRDGMYRALEAEGIAAGGGRGLQILWRVAQEGLICFGTREGKQHRFALLDEWVPGARRLARDEALAELARRYFTSHEPATLQDFVWWSGLTTGNARAGLEMVKSLLAHEVVDGHNYWFSQNVPIADEQALRAYLLPSYDEYTVGYRDRSALFDPTEANEGRSGSDVLHPVMVVDGRVRGTWKRVVKKDRVVVTRDPFGVLTAVEAEAVERAASRYSRFLGMPVSLS
ncbi:MAG TPA: crosslink repair DNA glycosylase YcaQ family protein, partial [Ardenticatenaceae bacterium]|nr:crosslink repair DNA glycosylase YcaQ family protein [Ardenticatenaceae bacterium]